MDQQGLSRRDAIKRVAGGAAVVWAAPAVLSSPAFGATGSPCDTPFVCGAALVPCGSTSTMQCMCVLTVEGDRFCATDFFCRNTRTCTSSAQCPPGWRCQAAGAGCCGQVCVPPCGEVAPSTRRRHGRNSQQ